MQRSSSCRARRSRCTAYAALHAPAHTACTTVHTAPAVLAAHAAAHACQCTQRPHSAHSER
eukprot:7013754-Alexandrium_andersonii.AAC.1